MLERILGTTDPGKLSRHAGILTAIYTLAFFLLAPVWGQMADRHGRKPVILLGLIGAAATLGLLAVAENLPLLYLGRLLNGMFASAITPAAYALVGEHVLSKELRAHRFALLNVAGASGFLVGPIMGGPTMLLAREILPKLGETAVLRTPFLVTASFAFLVSLAVFTFVPDAPRRKFDQSSVILLNTSSALIRLLLISFVTGVAIGAFEVSLSLHSVQALRLSPSQIGLIFAECSLVMLIVQLLVFSIVRPDKTRWLFTPAILVLTFGLATVPLATTSILIAVTVAAVAASAGILSPITIYWVSLGAGEMQGTQLGRQTAAASLGQTVGSAAGGLLFGTVFVPNAPFTLAAGVVLSSLVASIGLPRLLASFDRIDVACSDIR